MIRFHPDALAEMERARDWYDAQRVGLGGDLVATVERVLDAIDESPEAFPRTRETRLARRAAVPPFSGFDLEGDRNARQEEGAHPPCRTPRSDPRLDRGRGLTLAPYLWAHGPLFVRGCATRAGRRDRPKLTDCDDVVLCTVRGQHFLHLIKAIRGTEFQIGNNRGGINGWVDARAIHGRCVAVET